MCPCWTNTTAICLHKEAFVLVEQEDIFCWARGHVFVLISKTCLVVQQKQISPCPTREAFVFLSVL
jgi:hypothetical protein